MSGNRDKWVKVRGGPTGLETGKHGLQLEVT